MNAMLCFGVSHSHLSIILFIGMLRGALANLGVLAMVNADFNVLPACTFNIRIKT